MSNQPLYSTMISTDNSSPPRRSSCLNLQRKSIGDMFGGESSPNNNSFNSTFGEEYVCHTPPTTHRVPQRFTPEMDVGRHSPVIMTMSQRALKLGVDVTWASSPTRRSSSPLIDRRVPTPPIHSSPSPKSIIRRKSLKNRQIFKPPSPKRGLYKFQEDLKTIMPLLNQPTSSNSTNECDTLHDSNYGSVINTLTDNVFSQSTSTNQSLATESIVNQPLKALSASPLSSDFLSTSIQNEFLDDSDTDMALFRSSQEVEIRLSEERQLAKQQKAGQTKSTVTSTNRGQPKKAISKAVHHLFNDECSFPENDSIDEFMSSKELDLLISSQTMNQTKPALERHKSLPFQMGSILSISDEILSQFPDEVLDAPITKTVRNSLNTSLERHNSMPVSKNRPGSSFVGYSKTSQKFSDAKQRVPQAKTSYNAIYEINSDTEPEP